MKQILARTSLLFTLGLGPTAAYAPISPASLCAGWETLFWENTRVELIEACKAASFDFNSRGQDGISPLHLAAHHSFDVAVIKALIEAGANVNARDVNGMTPLHVAQIDGVRPEMLYLYDENGATPFGSPPEDFLRDRTIALIEAGADVDARNTDGMTPLHIAALFGNAKTGIKVIRTLIDAGADVNARMNGGMGMWTPLALSAGGNPNPEVVLALVKFGADINVRDESGHTPLRIAVEYSSNLDVIETLIEAGADVNIKDGLEKSPLHWAAQSGSNPNLVLGLLDAGADGSAVAGAAGRVL